MKRVVLTFGIISGVMSAVMMLCTLPFEGKIGSWGMVIGYTTMVAAFLMVYFGIRSYRDTHGAGRISFGKAFLVGILISLITCAFYVATWEVIFFNFMPDFMEKYTAAQVEKVKASGASDAVVQARIQQLEKSRVMYHNPVLNVAMTFLEPFPVGLLITLISAGLLRRKEPTISTQEAVAASS